VRYVAEGEPMMKAQCHCRECQYISGGSPQHVSSDAARWLQLYQGKRPSNLRAAILKAR